MSLTGIGDARTPGQAIELVFTAETGLPSANQTVTLIGHKHATSGTVAANTVVTINNSADPVAGGAEADGYFGAGTELAGMVRAAINANFLTGGANFPTLKCCALASTDTGIAAAALAAIDKAQECEYLVSPYPWSNSANLTTLKGQVLAMSAAGRVDNNQFGTFGVVAEMATAVGSLTKTDTLALIACYLRDTAGSPSNTVPNLAAACGAMMAGNPAPFNPQDRVVIGGVNPPTNLSDYLTVGPNDESETVLQAGFTPLRVLPGNSVAFVRTITMRYSPDGSGSPEVTAYFDNQDFSVLYLWRKTLATRFAQPDFAQKNSVATQQRALSEMLRLAKVFEGQNMFQAVDRLASQFQVVLRASDRSAFEYLTPVNVIPGLHRKLGRIAAGTQFDSIVL